MPNSLLFLYICHTLSDFYLQSDEIARHKKFFNRAMMKHSLIYSLPFISILYFSKSSFLYVVFIISSHILIDIFTVQYKEKYRDKECLIFCVDQVLHIIIITICFLNMKLQIPISYEFLSILFAGLLLVKPVSIFISLVFRSIFKNEKDTDNIKIGRYIGYLERIIIFLLCIFDAISTIGFILAAKTLVRYKDISANDNHFQEKYLIGTLLSTIGALCCFAIVKFK